MNVAQDIIDVAGYRKHANEPFRCINCGKTRTIFTCSTEFKIEIKKNTQNINHKLTAAVENGFTERPLMLTQFHPFGSSITVIITNLFGSDLIHIHSSRLTKEYCYGLEYCSLCANNP